MKSEIARTAEHGRTVLKSEDGIVVWLDDEGKVSNLWIDKGQTSVANSLKEPDDAIAFARACIAAKEVPCCTCGEMTTTEGKGHGSGAYFAGYYCDPCWKKFAAANSRRCGICGQPISSCCC